MRLLIITLCGVVVSLTITFQALAERNDAPKLKTLVLCGVVAEKLNFVKNKGDLQKLLDQSYNEISKQLAGKGIKVIDAALAEKTVLASNKEFSEKLKDLMDKGQAQQNQMLAKGIGAAGAGPGGDAAQQQMQKILDDPKMPEQTKDAVRKMMAKQKPAAQAQTAPPVPKAAGVGIMEAHLQPAEPTGYENSQSVQTLVACKREAINIRGTSMIDPMTSALTKLGADGYAIVNFGDTFVHVQTDNLVTTNNGVQRTFTKQTTTNLPAAGFSIAFFDPQRGPVWHGDKKIDVAKADPEGDKVKAIAQVIPKGVAEMINAIY